MKKAFKIAAVYTGLVIGAGFASGREVLEYFNFRSNTNMTGILTAAALFMIICYIILAKASEEGLTDFDSYVDSVAGGMASLVKTFMLVYMFCGMFVMYSGSGALVDDISVFPKIYGAVLMAAICFAVMSFDLKGIVALNLILVPLMILGIIFVSVCAAAFSDVPTFSPFGGQNGEIVLSAVCYAAYNTVTAGAVLVPLAGGCDTPTIRRASVGGGFCIGLLILIVWTVQGLNFDIIYRSELPMLTLAAMCGKLCKRIYTAVLFMAICTTAVSYGFGLMSHFSDKITSVRRRVLFSGIICLSALPPAMYGFSNLVSHLYSLFGYIGMIWMVMVIVDRYK